jgi:hypothetical protein
MGGCYGKPHDDDTHENRWDKWFTRKTINPRDLPAIPDLTKRVVDLSTCVYSNPSKKDMAVCFVYFNPVGSKRLLMNYLYTIEKLRLASIPYYTLELVYKTPEINDAFHIKGKSVYFCKEHLCRLLEKKVPRKFKKLLFLDADVIFEEPTWYSSISDLLDSADVVHPFSSAHWLDISYTNIVNERLSCLYMDRTKIYDPKLHPGFGWAFRRDWYRKVGFYDYGVTGSGDTLSAAAWMNMALTKGYVRQAHMKSYVEFRKHPQPRITCANGAIFHLWHGSIKNRKYNDRHDMLIGISDITTLLKPNKGKFLELTNDPLRSKFTEYFKGRDDDGYD